MATPEETSAFISKLQAIRASERRLLQTLIDRVPDLVYVKDQDSRFIIANNATALLMGANSADDLIGRTDLDFYPEPMAKSFRTDEVAVMERGQQFTNQEECAVDPLGTDRWLLTTKVPLKDASGVVTGLIGVGRDITLRRRAEEALRQANTALKEHQRADREEIERLRAEVKKLRGL